MSTIEETGQQLREILQKVEALQSLFREMSRDQLLELWMKRDEAGHYGDPVHQYAIIVALKRNHNTDAPLYPYDHMTDQQRFSLQPSYIIAETERSVRAKVESSADYAFGVMERCRFSLDAATRVALVEERIRQEMSENGHKYWRK